MKSDCKLYIQNGAGSKFFGKGPLTLLKLTQELGSLNRAAKSMDMAYSKAFRLVKDAEEAVGFPLLERQTGGKDGGGSKLTRKAVKWIAMYEAWEQDVRAYSEAKYNEIFNAEGNN